MGEIKWNASGHKQYVLFHCAQYCNNTVVLSIKSVFYVWQRNCIKTSTQTIQYEALSKKCNCTLGFSPNNRKCWSDSIFLATVIMSRHFFGVSSTFPARNKQAQAVT